MTSSWHSLQDVLGIMLAPGRYSNVLVMSRLLGLQIVARDYSILCSLTYLGLYSLTGQFVTH